MTPNFDPYDALCELNDRLDAVEEAHNNLADAHQELEIELQIVLDALLSLQMSHKLLLDFTSDMSAYLGYKPNDRPKI